MKTRKKDFNLLNKEDKAFIRELVKDPSIEDFGEDIDEYAFECQDLGELDGIDIEAWKDQLLEYARQIDTHVEESVAKKPLKEYIQPDKFMSVGELIEALSEYPEDYPVEVITYNRGSSLGGCEGFGYVERIGPGQYGDPYVTLYAYHGGR